MRPGGAGTELPQGRDHQRENEDHHGHQEPSSCGSLARRNVHDCPPRERTPGERSEQSSTREADTSVWPADQRLRSNLDQALVGERKDGRMQPLCRAAGPSL
jgi:hypothetical protein